MNDSLLGIGLYTSSDASRYIGAPIASIRNWLSGREYSDAQGERHYVPPLWKTDVYLDDCQKLHLSFRDLVETRFVYAFRRAGLPLQRIRLLYQKAQEIIDSDRPFSSAQFHTDGKSIFLEDMASDKEIQAVLDLKNCQQVFKNFIEPTFKDLEYSNLMPIKWFLDKKANIVLDPQRNFGQPILMEYNIPTSSIDMAYRGGMSEKEVADSYEIPIKAVRAAVNFESH